MSLTDPPTEKPRPSLKKWISLFVKAAFSVGMVAVIIRKIVLRDGIDDLQRHLSNMSWGWIGVAVLMQLLAIAASTARWQRLLVGQGIRASWRFLIGSIMIARFWGAFTPGGFTGFGGWRIYDVAKHTGKTARATATIGVEMILGQLAFGVVVMGASVFGARFIGTSGVILVNLFFLSLITAGMVVLAKPTLVRAMASFLPAQVRGRVQTLVDAVCAYQGKSKLLVQAACLGVGTHAFNNLIFVCAARALGTELTVGEVFFGSSLQIFATLLPASINGIGLREAAAVALYTRLGVPASEAVLIPIVGFAAEMFVSAFGGLVFVARRSGYEPNIIVEDPDREKLVQEALPDAPEAQWPKRLEGLWLGAGAGLMAGFTLGLGEAVAVIVSGGGRAGFGVTLYGAVSYGIIFLFAGAGAGLVSAWSGRLMRRAAVAAEDAYPRAVALMVAAPAFAIGAFRIRRDVFHEELVWKSPKGLLILLGCAVAAALLYFVIAAKLRFLVRRFLGAYLLRPWARRRTWR